MKTTMDTSETPTRTTRTPALVAGVGLLLMTVLAPLAIFGAVEGLVSEGNATRTAQDILASEGMFRFAVVALVLVAILDVIVAWALFEFFKAAHEGLSALAAWLRIAYAAVFAVAISQLAGTLHLLSDAEYLKTFSTAQLHTEALLKIDAFNDIWNIGLVPFGLHLLLIGCLAYRSGYVPKPVGVLLAIAGIGYLVDSFGVLLASDYSANVAAFTGLGEALFMVWLLAKGRSVAAGK
ncbi:MAG: DUF4386 domain-containing protein [Actinomycetota bacterium]|nr:DUF4386 domain-containing protein [Actinomycetota bacterium]